MASAHSTQEVDDMAEEAPKRKPRRRKPKPVASPEESVQFLLDVAENALRDALPQAAGTAHPIQLESITDALLSVASAKHFLSKDPDYFVNKLDD